MCHSDTVTVNSGGENADCTLLFIACPQKWLFISKF